MKTQRSQHSMDLDGAFSGRTGAGSGEFGSEGIARSGNMGSKPPVSNVPILSGINGMGDVTVGIDNTTMITALLAIGGGLFLWYKFGR